MTGKPMLLCLFLLTALAPAAISAQPPDKAKDAVFAAQRLMIHQNYSEATAKIKAVLKDEPNNIDAIFTLATIEQTRILDYETFSAEGKRFQVFADSLLKILEARQPHLRGADSLRCLFYRANITGGIGLVHTKRGARIDGARSGMAAQSLYKQVKKIDPGHLGADLGLGVFDYYFGTSMQKIPFVSGGGVQKGLEALERSLQAPFPFKNAAKSSYCWILIDRHQFKKADSLARSALIETPGNTIFLRIRAYIALWTGCYGDAIAIAQKLAAASESRRPINQSDLLSSYYIIASSHDNMGNQAEARAAASKGLDLHIHDTLKSSSHIKEHIKNLNAIRSKNSPK